MSLTPKEQSSITMAYIAIQRAQKNLAPVEDYLADSVDPTASNVITSLNDAQDHLVTAGALTSSVKETF